MAFRPKWMALRTCETSVSLFSNSSFSSAVDRSSWRSFDLSTSSSSSSSPSRFFFAYSTSRIWCSYLARTKNGCKDTLLSAIMVTMKSITPNNLISYFRYRDFEKYKWKKPQLWVKQYYRKIWPYLHQDCLLSPGRALPRWRSSILAFDCTAASARHIRCLFFQSSKNIIVENAKFYLLYLELKTCLGGVDFCEKKRHLGVTRNF